NKNKNKNNNCKWQHKDMKNEKHLELLVNDHLEHSCCLQMVKCWFESFGCNHKCLRSAIDDHLTSNMKLHFDLVIKSFDALQQTIRQYKEEINKLNLENETLKVELQLKSKKDEEISYLKQRLGQYQKDNTKLISDQVYLYLYLYFHLI
ncbi:hypothetical protein RFI_37638, partial [Reticulomyxa filosa]